MILAAMKEINEVLIHPDENRVLHLFTNDKNCYTCTGLLDLFYITLKTHLENIHRELHSNNIAKAVDLATNGKNI